MNRRNAIAGCATLAVAPWLLRTATAQTFPSKPIRLFVGFPAGGSVDIAARLMAEKLKTSLGQAVVVENRPGAAGNLAATVAAKAPTDGYTVYVNTSVNAASPSLFKNLGYDPIRDFTPIARWVTTAYVLIVAPSLPIRSVPDLVAYAKANPGVLNYGSTGNGSPAHLAGALFDLQAGTKMVHVPFKGGPEVMTSMVSGAVQLTFSNIPSALPFIQDGRVRAVAVTSLARTELMPSIPTVAEQGFPNFEVISWYGAVAPTGTPSPIVATLAGAMETALQGSDIRSSLSSQGLEPAPLGPKAFGEFYAREVKKYADLIAATHIQPD